MERVKRWATRGGDNVVRVRDVDGTDLFDMTYAEWREQGGIELRGRIPTMVELFTTESGLAPPDLTH